MNVQIDLEFLKNKNIVVALSGGADSIAVLHYLATNTDLKFTAVHVHHGLQVIADEWVPFCKNFCRDLNVPFAVEYIKLNDSSENSAREHRYNALRKYGDLIITGHHADDQIETFFMKLVRGAGVGGLQCMETQSLIFGAVVYRPLLAVTRVEIESYCQEHNLDFVIDPTNLQNDYDRNFFRNTVIPEISARFVGVKNAILKSIGNIADAQKCLEDLAYMDLNAVIDDGKINLGLVRHNAMSEERVRNMLMYLINNNNLTVNYNDLKTFSAKMLTISYNAQMEMICKNGSEKVKFKQHGKYITLPIIN